MKKIGIVGGVSWQSTADYYSGICRLSEQAHSEARREGIAAIPEMAIESLSLRRAVSILGMDSDESSWSEFDALHREALMRLERSGADFAVIASNTPHHRLGAICRGVRLPVLDLFEELAVAAAAVGSKEVLILGTATTMNSQTLRLAFERQGITASGPRSPGSRGETLSLLDEIHTGKSSGSKERLEAIVAAELAAGAWGQPTVCLACTELPPLLEYSGGAPVTRSGRLTYLNSSWVHIRAAFDVAVGTRRR